MKTLLTFILLLVLAYGFVRYQQSVVGHHTRPLRVRDQFSDPCLIGQAADRDIRACSSEDRDQPVRGNDER